MTRVMRMKMKNQPMVMMTRRVTLLMTKKRMTLMGIM